MEAVAALPFLTDAEVDALCAGLTQSAAKVRFISEVLKVPVARKPNGRPLVMRADVERATLQSGAAPSGRGATVPASNEPNWLRKAKR